MLWFQLSLRLEPSVPFHPVEDSDCIIVPVLCFLGECFLLPLKRFLDVHIQLLSYKLSGV